MGAGETAIPAALYVIPLVLVVTVVGLYLLARSQQRKTQVELRQFRNDWRQFLSAYRQIEQAAQFYVTEGQEPFRSKATALLEALVDLDQHSEYFRAQHYDLHRRANELGGNRWNTLVGAPYLWLFLRKDVVRTRQELERAKTSLASATEVEKELRRLGWAVALRAREVQQLERRAKSLVEQLQARGMQGATIEKAVTQVDQVQAALDQIPPFFLRGQEADVLAQADRDSIVLAHDVLEQNRPVLEAIWLQAQEWDHRCKEATDRVAVLQRLLGETGQTLDNLPPGMNVAAEKGQFSQFQVIAQNLNATLSRLEVESVGDVIGETTRLMRAAQEMNGQLKRARRDLAALQGLLKELPESYQQCSLLMATLSAKSVCPVAWKPGLDELAGLNRQTNALGLVGAGRTPDEVSRDLAVAIDLSARQKGLARRCQEIEQAHGELVALLAEPSLGPFTAWLQNTRRLAEQIKGYAPENWSRADAVASLPDEIEGLAQEAQRVLPSDLAAALPETEIVERAGHVRRLLEAYQAMQQRVENIQTRLDDLRASEATAREQLENAQTTLGQIAFIVRSNEFLSDLATQEAATLADQLRHAQEQLAQPQRGAVEKKARQANELAERVERAANQWLADLSKDIQAMAHELSALLAGLDRIAQLEDAPVTEARNLLSSGPAYTRISPAAGRFAGKTTLALGDVLAELKRSSDYWQACAAALHALKDFEAPLVDTYDNASYFREQTRLALKESATWLGQKRTWPPTSISLDAERQELEALEGEWQAMQESTARVVQLVAKLGDLSRRYQALAGKIDQLAERAGREQAQVEQVEGEITEMAQTWQTLMYDYHSNEAASQEIRGLLESINRELSQIRRRSTSGSMAYNQVLQSLGALHKKVRYYKVALDENSALDSTGNVVRRR